MQDFLLFGVSGYEPAWSGAWAIYLSKDGEGYTPALMLSLLPPKHLSLGMFAVGCGPGPGKGEVEGRKEISWVWGYGEWDKVGVLSLRLGLCPWAGGRGQG